MIPLRDTTRSHTIPYVNYLFIAICIAVFLLELTLDQQATDRLVSTFAVIPADIHRTLLAGDFAVHPVISLFTSMFLHGGWGHILGNMLYLYVFGDNVEDRLGHRGYFFFYALCGAGAALIEAGVQGPSPVPLIGASGAIAGVLGAYFLLFPKARVLTLIPLIILFPVVEISAFFFLGFWFLMQFLQGSLSLGSSGEGGVAWWAHAGGFLAGAVLLPFFLVLRRLRS
jgi:membrane associated rhomboid family serine protease